MTQFPMTPQTVSLAVLAGLVLAGATISLLALWRAQALLFAQPKPAPGAAAADAAIEVLQQRIEAVQQELRDLRLHAPTAAVVPSLPRPALNLDKRSQALRMHRRGETPAQIASSLEIPLQEVELLLKVHRIVLSAI